MNKIRIAAIISSNAGPFHIQASSFHTTRVLERRRRTYWDSGERDWSGSSKRSTYYNRRDRLKAKRELLCNVNSFAEEFFQSWQYDSDDYDPSESRSRSWFREEFKRDGYRGGKSRNKGRREWSRNYQFFVDVNDDFEAENVFRSAFGGNFGYSFYSFINDEGPRWRKSSRHSNDHWFHWSWGRQQEEETESNKSDSDLASDRLALGLSASGPLSLDQVKSAYRTCALKWHPDRHSGSSKAVAEEKFKLCSAAYQSLCDKLVLN